ncbi:MAG: DUF1501 domain-containing protein [Pirellulales bacterium]
MPSGSDERWRRYASREARYDRYQQQAFSLLTSPEAKRALALEEEPDDVRDRYGPSINGQCALMCRRLVEAGVPFVNFQCQTALFAGGGIRGGQVFGASDKIAAYPKDQPVQPEHVAATVYDALGIYDDLWVHDAQQRPSHLLENGHPLPLFG